ncbi:MAG: DUF5721 family protein [Roseburia sp.]
MIALNLPEIKDFMNKLLCSETFDHFLIKEAVIKTAATWSLDGGLNQEFYSSEELKELGYEELSFLPFGALRPQCFDLIKGKRTPAYFRFVFLLSPANLSRTLESLQSSYTPADISGVFLNLKFQNGQLLLTTGISYRIFSVDKSLEHEWDNLVKRFLKNNGIVFEEL